MSWHVVLYPKALWAMHLPVTSTLDIVGRTLDKSLVPKEYSIISCSYVSIQVGEIDVSFGGTVCNFSRNVEFIHMAKQWSVDHRQCEGQCLTPFAILCLYLKLECLFGAIIDTEHHHIAVFTSWTTLLDDRWTRSAQIPWLFLKGHVAPPSDVGIKWLRPVCQGIQGFK